MGTYVDDCQDRRDRRLAVLQQRLHATERERDDARAKLADHEQVSALATIACGVAHEVNNPIQGILSYAQLLEEALPAASMEHAYASHILTACQHMRAVLGDVLLMARNTHEPAQQVDPHELIEAACTLTRRALAEDRIMLDVELAPQLPPLVGCSRQLLQVITNLILNARDALSEADVNQRRRVTVRAAASDGMVSFEVVDNGTGIPEAELPNIFTAFFTTKGPGKGSGLGLAISRTIVLGHGGTIWAENRPDGGARVVVQLPCDRQPAERPGPARIAGGCAT